jgi:hypothetical protein
VGFGSRNNSPPIATPGDMQYPLSDIWMNIFPGHPYAGQETRIEKVNQTDAE